MEEGVLVSRTEKLKMPYRLLIYFGTLVLLAGLFAWLVFLPKQRQIEKTKKEIARLEQKLAQARVRARNLKKFEAELKEVDSEFQRVLRILPNKKEIPALLRNITQLGAESNLTFVLFSPKKEKAKQFYVEIPVEMVVQGRYHDAAMFFYKIGRMDRIVKILDFSMKPVKQDSDILLTKCNAVT
ncbi:MAG: type 4a pilus biogenesis protein PilO, partial [Deltaproteobacteria bacterium]|nr:type 4a pilus biogenesis protein PilO [Deltaproteobacteria bacterium]